MTPDELIAFERDIADRYNAGDIKAPVHLDGGNESQLIDHFARHYHPGDWVLCSWRSHYKALLAGVPQELLRAEILAGHSIAINLPGHRVLSSAIVAGHLPIALGIAMALCRSNSPNHVHAFVGDMAYRTGTFHEVFQYAHNHDLPLRLIVEDNGRSVQTPTHEPWGHSTSSNWSFPIGDNGSLTYFTYVPTYPHSGAGKWIDW